MGYATIDVWALGLNAGDRDLTMSRAQEFTDVAEIGAKHLL